MILFRTVNLYKSPVPSIRVKETSYQLKRKEERDEGPSEEGKGKGEVKPA